MPHSMQCRRSHLEDAFSFESPGLMPGRHHPRSGVGHVTVTLLWRIDTRPAFGDQADLRVFGKLGSLDNVHPILLF
jgi:hypothetical protein